MKVTKSSNCFKTSMIGNTTLSRKTNLEQNKSAFDKELNVSDIRDIKV